MHDIHVDDFVEVLALLEPLPPVTAEYSMYRPHSGWVPIDLVQYQSQKAHMVIWFACQTTKGSGQYTRSRGNSSSRKTYMRFLNQYGLLWVAEVLGECEATLRRAIEAANAAERINYRRRCTAFRQIIPFERIMELLGKPESWLIDGSIKRLIAYDASGKPYIPGRHEREFLEVLKQEDCL